MKALHTLLSALPTFAMSGDDHALARAVTSIQYDSRQCSDDALFVAMRGMAADGHDFIGQAIERGARFIVAEREVEVPNTVAFVVVPDARKALAILSHTWFDEPSTKLRIFGVTGTNGKTTTTFMLKSLLEQSGENVGIIGTTGNYIGGEVLPASFTTPEAPELCALFVEMRKRGATAIIMEVSSHALSLERVYGTIFAGAIFTNLTQDHLDFHGTMQDYAAAKQRLFSMLPSTSFVVVNADDEWSDFMTSASSSAIPPQNRRSYGRSERADIRISDVRLGFTQTEFSVLEKNGDSKAWYFSMSPIGGFNVDNAAGCLAMMRLLGVSWEELVQHLSNVQGAPGRMQRIPLNTSNSTASNGSASNGQASKQSAVAIVDYAHTPDALEKALLSCKELRDASFPGGRIICVFGCGGNRDRTKRPKMGAIAARLADLIIPTSDNPRNEDPLTILDDILAGIPKEKFPATTVLADRREAIHHAIGLAKAGDIVLIAGKGHETYQIIGSERIHFDDVEVVQEFA